MPRRCTCGALRSRTVLSMLRCTAAGCAAPPCWMVWVSSCAIRLRPGALSGSKRPRPKNTSLPTVKAAALMRRLARAAPSPVCTRTAEKSAWKRGSISRRKRRGSGRPTEPPTPSAAGTLRVGAGTAAARRRASGDAAAAGIATT